MTKAVLFFGFGYTASHCAALLKNAGYQIFATSRDVVKRNNLRQGGGYNTIDFAAQELKKIIHQVSDIIISIPPSSTRGQGKRGESNNSDPVLRDMTDILSEYSSNINSLIYFSSTGVYGDHKGEWVNENTIINPNNDRNIVRAQVEKDWQNFGTSNNTTVKIFRLGGIYGPYRSALDQIKNGVARSIDKRGQVFSRINVKDIANIVKLAVIEHGDLSGIFNLCDDYPCSTIEVNQYAADLLQVSPPEIIKYEEANLSVMTKEFYNSCRRVDNKKITNLLNIDLLFPHYKAGLLDIYDKQEY